MGSINISPPLIDEPITTLTDGATVTYNQATTTRNAKITLGGDRTLDITNPVVGRFCVVSVIQDGTGGWSLALPSNSIVVNDGAGVVDLTTAAGGEDDLCFYYDGTNFRFTIGANLTGP